MSGARQWADTAIWWHVYPLGFVGADTTTNPHGVVVHELPRVTAWLDDLLALGCNGLLLGPVFDSETHGYDTIDHLRIDPRLGDDADADALFAACRERGIRVLLDGVFNHVGRSHPWWREAVEAGPGSPASTASRHHGWDRPTWLNTPSRRTRMPRCRQAAKSASASASSPSRGSTRRWSMVS